MHVARPGGDDLDPEPLAQALVDQLLRHHGCGQDPSSSESPRPSHPVTVTELIRRQCPDVLGEVTIAQYPTPWDELCPPAQRRLLYTGLGHELSPSTPEEPPTVDIDGDTVSHGDSLQVCLDIDSAGGIASSLAVAREGLHWRAGRPPISNLQSSLHLNPIAVQWTDVSTGRLRHSKQPIHRIPHLPFGRVAGFSELEMYLIFPRLYEHNRQQWVITLEEFVLWTDRIFLPALHQTYPTATVQHFPSSAAHIQLNATAARREGLTQADSNVPRAQDFHFMLQPESLAGLWDEVQRRTEQEGLSQFQQCRILLTSKNLKLATQRSTWAGTRDVFFHRWNQAVDPAYLEHDFFDVAKEVVPGRENQLMLNWRECCLYGFDDWLRQHEAAVDIEPGPSSLRSSEPVRRSQRATARRSHVSSAVVESDDDGHDNASSEGRQPVEGDDDADEEIDDETDNETRDETGDESGNDTGDSVDEAIDSSDGPEEESNPPRKPASSWRQMYYPQSLLRAQGSLTLEPSPRNPVRKRGLQYCQFYNASKEVLAAGNHYPFQNERLDTLSLDPGMARTWQHVGGAVCHSPLTLLRAYLHTKQRCHTALQGCRTRSYGTREEYRVTGTLLCHLDRLFTQSGQAESPLPPPTGHLPFSVHTTALMLDWWRWNLNKLCLGFEMTYSLQPRTVVHWEHTRVMMMFLRCLACIFGGQGQHLRRSLGLWIDRRVRRAPDGSDQEQVQEGLALGPHLERYCYAWMADKLDWAAMTFRPPHRAHMVFNTPSLQSAYVERYGRVVETKGDFLLFHDVFDRLHTLRHDPRRSALLLQLLVDLCLQVFRKDVFQTLAGRRTQQPLSPSSLQEACAGTVPLTRRGFRQVFEHGLLDDDLQFVTGPHMRVTHIENLFAWLWGWDGDGCQGDWERVYWEFKPYRVLYRQCFGVIAQLHGLRQAREWRVRVKQTWIRTHWILPYPSPQTFWSRGPHQRLQTWVSVHRGLVPYYRDRTPTHSGVISPHEVDDLPVSGWERAGVPGPLDIELPPVPSDLEVWLAAIDGSPVATVPEIPLPARGVRVSGLSRSLEKSAPSQRVLRSFMRDRELSESQLHTNEEWFSQHLVDHIRAAVVAYQHEIKGLQQPANARHWQARPRPRLTQGLSRVHLSVHQVEDDDSDPDNTQQVRGRLSRRLGRTQKRLHLAQHEVRRLAQCDHRMDQTRKVARHPDWTLTMERWDEEKQVFRSVRDRHRLSMRRLERLSRESTRPWVL